MIVVASSRPCPPPVQWCALMTGSHEVDDGGFDGGVGCGADDEAELDRGREDAELPARTASRRRLMIPPDVSTALFAVGLLVALYMCITSASDAQRDPSAESVWSSSLQTESELLRVGRHCFSSLEVMGAALQRALAGIDRYRWENEQEQRERNKLSEGTAGFGLNAVEPDHPEAHLHISRPSTDDDEARCFVIALPPGGSYLPFGT